MNKRYTNRHSIKEIKKRHIIDNHSRFYYLIKGIFISVIISLPLFFIIAYIFNFTSLPEKYMPTALLTSVLISLVIASFYSTSFAKAKGWFNGSLIGFIYMFILVIIRWITESRISLNKDIFTMLLCGLLIGSVCGIAGLNLGDKIRKAFYKK